jgi:hypothetical protein
MNSDRAAAFPLRCVIHTVLLNDAKGSRLWNLRIKHYVDIIGKRGASCGNTQQSDDQGWSKEFHSFCVFLHGLLTGNRVADCGRESTKKGGTKGYIF